MRKSSKWKWKLKGGIECLTILRVLGSILTLEEQNMLLFFNRLNLFSHKKKTFLPRQPVSVGYRYPNVTRL